MTYAQAHNPTHCARCGAEADELYCVDEFNRAEPESWECVSCIRAAHPGAIEPEWEMTRSTEEGR
jgi:hypothetical protein